MGLRSSDVAIIDAVAGGLITTKRADEIRRVLLPEIVRRPGATIARARTGLAVVDPDTGAELFLIDWQGKHNP